MARELEGDSYFKQKKKKKIRLLNDCNILLYETQKYNIVRFFKIFEFHVLSQNFVTMKKLSYSKI